jgi:predicted transcriptional regulator
MAGMIRNDTDIQKGLLTLGLDDDEIKVYLALLHTPAAPLALSKHTGIKRTKVYSLLEKLEKRSLVARQTDEHGTFYTVTEPSNLGIELNDNAAKLEQQQEAFYQLVPMLNALRGIGRSSSLTVRTYEGAEGFKQMLWHELKAKGELLSFGGGDIEELIPDRKWASRHRERVAEAGYRVREIINSETDLPTFIDNRDYLQLYTCRGISARTVSLEDQIVIYNDTVAIYGWRQAKKMGVEVVSKSFADTMRSVFECFWKLTEPTITRHS